MRRFFNRLSDQLMPVMKPFDYYTLGVFAGVMVTNLFMGAFTAAMITASYIVLTLLFIWNRSHEANTDT